MQTRLKRNPRRENGTPEDPSRSFRLGDTIWTAAQERAAAEGKTISYVLVQLITAYANGDLVIEAPVQVRPAATQ